MLTPRKVPADIQPATPADVPLLLSLIRELAEYERLAHEAVATEALLREALFGKSPAAEAVVCRHAGEPVGFALYYTTFSTFQGLPGIYLEDLFVRPAHRGQGHGRALLAHVARVAHRRGCGRLEWSVLDWNEPAIGFYRSLGAEPLDDWIRYRLSGSALANLAGRGTPTAPRPSASSRGTRAGSRPRPRTRARRGC